MRAGDVVLAELSQADGAFKFRPAIILATMEPFGDLLICGVSTQLRHEVRGFDEVIFFEAEDFLNSGLLQASLIRVGFLATYPKSRIAGILGAISSERLLRLRGKLAAFLLK